MSGPASALTEDLNRHCHCIAVDPADLARALEKASGEAGAHARILREQPHLFSSSAVFLSREHLARMQAVVAAVESVVALAAFREMALRDAPALARFDPGPRGVFLGYDFHVGEGGPQLIEINTNAGGALLNVALASAQRACCAEVATALAAPPGSVDIEERFLAMFRREWALQRGDAPLRSVAIVDEAPASQYLHPEFRMFRELFEKAGLEARILDSADLEFDGDALSSGGRSIDLVYNRLTDFALEHASSAPLGEALRQGRVVVTPGPRAHALYADKRHLALLSDDARLAGLGVAEATRALLLAAVPRTVVVGDDNREQLWQQRRRLFFKPAGGFGSRAAYRGAKLTRGVWEEIAARPYVAQREVPPSRRTIVQDGKEVPLKLDLRCYVYDGEVQLVAARLYAGQTTNFRTAGGGFAPVFTESGDAGERRA